MVHEKLQEQYKLDEETVGCVLFSGKICMPEMSSDRLHEEKTLLQIWLEAMLNEDFDLRKTCKRKQTEGATEDLQTLVEWEGLWEKKNRQNSRETEES